MEALYDRARADMPTISLKTVYQTVHDLAELGELHVLDLGTGSLRIDPNVEDDAPSPRVHARADASATCRSSSTACGSRPRYRREFTVDDIQVIFRGRCETCAT